MITYFFVQYKKHRMQITQELSEYDLTTNLWSLCNKRATNDFTTVRSDSSN